MDRELSGPYDMVETPDGQHFPFYLIEYDKHGACTNQKALDHLVDEVTHRRIATPAGSPYTNVFLFSHGWNNDRAAAVNRYRSFLNEFVKVWFTHASQDGITQPIRPILVGLIWPSAILTGDNRLPPGLDAVETDLAYISDDLEPGTRSTLWSALTSDDLDEQTAHAAVETLRPLHGAADEADLLEIATDGDTDPPSTSELLDEWGALALAMYPDAYDVAAEDIVSLEAADLFIDVPWLDKLKSGIRAVTVRTMKRRAGVVGEQGVSSLLDRLLDAVPDAHLHLIGHSYGCKVLLSAVRSAHLSRPVNSALLLQPAISAQCFAREVKGNGHPGGYRRAVDSSAIEQPILSTFSSTDFQLHRIYHGIFWLRNDPGEIRLFLDDSGAFNRFWALGGHGPQNMESGESDRVEIQDPGASYAPLFTGGKLRVVGLDGNPGKISGHGDVVSEHTAWALYEQVTHA